MSPDREPARTVTDAIGDLDELTAGESGDVQAHDAIQHGSDFVEKLDELEHGQPIQDSTNQRIRLPPDEPSRTITSSRAQYAHPFQPRLLTVRERARIQTFPDDFHIFGERWQRREQTANAVPPLLAEKLAATIDDQLDET